MSMLTSMQIKLARHALRWSVAELATHTGVSSSTIKRIEASDGPPNSTKANLIALQKALEAAGIEFIGTPEDAPGIRIHKREDKAKG
jgi:transcriptional regulator with XRE-family HTH domain